MNKKKKNKNIIGYYIIGSAIIWGATLLSCSIILREAYTQISSVLFGASAIHLIIIWGPLAAQLKKQREE